MRTVLADSGQYPPPAWGAHPPVFAPDYKSTRLRGATRPLVPIRQSLSELTGPVFGQDSLGPLDNDLTKNARNDGTAPGEPLGERIVVSGKRSEEHTSEIQSLMRLSSAVFCLTKKKDEINRQDNGKRKQHH